jgi:hypothetical protein
MSGTILWAPIICLSVAAMLLLTPLREFALVPGLAAPCLMIYIACTECRKWLEIIFPADDAL